MIRQIDFFFDFMSPFAYLAHQRLPVLASEYGYVLKYKPINLPAAKKAAGNTGPSNREIPAKLRYLTTDMKRWAERYGVPMKFPPSLDSDLINKGTFYAIDRHQTQNYVAAAWRLLWGEGGDPSAAETLTEVALEMGWSPTDFTAYLNSPGAAECYRKCNQEAHRRGVFGVPTMLIGDDMWWGNDRLPFLAEHLKSLSTSDESENDKLTPSRR